MGRKHDVALSFAPAPGMGIGGYLSNLRIGTGVGTCQ